MPQSSVPKQAFAQDKTKLYIPPAISNAVKSGTLFSKSESKLGSGRPVYMHVHDRPDVPCPACQALESEAMKESEQLSPAMKFDDAAFLFIEMFNIETPGSNIRFLKKRTLDDFRQYSRALSRFFGQWKLSEIFYWRIHEYYKLRATGTDGGEISWERPAGANKIIQETNFLVRVMKRGGAWTLDHESHYKGLHHIDSDVPRALTLEEQNRWLATASQKPEWRLIQLYSIVAFATAANHIEMRQLKLRDINLHNEYIEIRSGSSKNKYRIRTIPLDPDSQSIWALERLMERARAMSADQSHHALFPARITNGIYDPCRSMSVHGLYRRWNEVRERAALPWFTPKDTRHTAITRWAESGMAIHVIMSLAGHIREQMQSHYVHISEVAKRKAVRSATISQYRSVQNGR